MNDHQAIYPVRTMCRLLGLSPSGYYAWRGRGPSCRARENAALTGEVLEIHARSDGTYGAPRIHAELRSNPPPPEVQKYSRLAGSRQPGRLQIRAIRSGASIFMASHPCWMTARVET